MLVSDTLGVYLGESTDPFITYWSGIQPAPVDEAPCFSTLDEVAEVMRGWGPQELEFLRGLRPVAVVPDIVVSGYWYASPSACALAGIAPWLNESTRVPLPVSPEEMDACFGEEVQRWQRPTMN